MSMSIAEALRLQTLEREVPELRKRLEALERKSAGNHSPQRRAPRAPNQLCDINAARQDRRARLCEAIASILARSRHPESLTGKDVEQTLAGAGFEPMPKPRTVRLRLAEVRQRAATHGNTLCCRKSA